MAKGTFLSRILPFLILTPALCLPLASCGGTENDPPSAEETTCPESFSFRPTNAANSVFLVGEWNGFDRSAHKMSGPDATGTYAIDVDLPPSAEWKYYFLVDGVVTLDPNAEGTTTTQATASTSSQTFSTVTVLCGTNSDQVASKIKLAVKPGSVSKEKPDVSLGNMGTFRATISVESGKGSIDDLKVTGTLRYGDGSKEIAQLSESELKLSDNHNAIEVEVRQGPGKYTIDLNAQNGAHSANITLPFWIEAEDFSFYDGPIYMVLIDRFRNGDTSNDQTVGGPGDTPVDFQGGDLWGVKQAIDEGFFDKLGVRSLWISPWQRQPNHGHEDVITSTMTVYASGYHGYWPVAGREVDPRFGGEAALKAMVQSAHAHGIRIIMDTVLNHVHEDHEYYRAHPNWFRASVACKDINWSEPITCMFAPYMPDIDWTNQEASEQFLSDVEWWVKEFDLDGLRLDAVKHMEDDVMGRLGTRMRSRFETAGTKFYMFGETFDGDVNLLKKYIGNGQLDGQFDFRRYFDGASNAFLNDGQGLSDVNRSTWDSINSFPDAMMVTFVGSHDIPRLISRSDWDNVSLTGNTWGQDYLPRVSTNQLAYDRSWMSLFHLMTTPGIPLIYYGDEYGEHGGSDPDNRHFMRTESQMTEQQKALFHRVQTLGQARQSLRGLRAQSFETMWVNDVPWGDGHGDLWAYVRRDPQGDAYETAVVVLNLKDQAQNDVELHSRDSLKLTDLGWVTGTVKDLITGNKFDLKDGAVRVNVPPRSGVILALEKSP